MCSAVTYNTRDFYFGRNLDYDSSYGECVTIMPRGYNPWRITNRFAVIGMAHVARDYPLFYDGVNEKGLCMAGLNFVGNAHYNEEREDADNVAQYEFIPRVLGECENLPQARELLSGINLTGTRFDDIPPAQLHWLIADKSGAIVVEPTAAGLRIYDNPAGVLTNNPPFDMQLFRLNDFMSLSPAQPENRFAPGLELGAYSRGMGAAGLPGDLSSQSRFVRAAFVRGNSVSDESEEASVSQVFHILGSVSQPRGCCETAPGVYEITLYTSCCNADKGIYYYTTYDSHRICAVDMRHENLASAELICYSLAGGGDILYRN